MNTSNTQAPTDLAAAIQKGSAQHRIKKRYWILAGFCLIVAFAWFLQSKKQQSAARGNPFVTQTVERGDIQLTITATGNLEPTNEVSVGSELSGTTLEVYVDSNDRVEKGQALAKLDTSTLENELKASRASLESAKANLLQAQATYKEAQATLNRQKELHRLSDGRLPSKADLAATEASAERARADVLSAEATKGEAEAQIEIKESDLAKAIIRSPTNGIVLTRSIEPGQTVAASFETPELFVIAEDLSQMKLEVAVAEADIGRVEAGQVASFNVDAWPDRSYAATVLKVSYGSEVTDNVVTYATELSVANEDLSLRPGMTATADIHVAHHTNILRVPVAALRFNPTPVDAQSAPQSSKGSFVDSLIPRPPRRSRGNGLEDGAQKGKTAAAIWILENAQPKRIEVETGLTDGSYTEVSSPDLNEGAQVIIRENRIRS